MKEGHVTDEERGPIDELTEEIIDQIGQFVIAHGEDTKTVLHALMKAVFVVLDNAPLGDKEPLCYEARHELAAAIEVVPYAQRWTARL